jgi:hypothetical protein
MRLKRRYKCLCALSLLLAGGSSAIAGPIFPCVRAASSRNGSFLVLADQYVPGQERVSLRVIGKENFINAYQRLAAPATYWGAEQAGWGVVLVADLMRNVPAPCLLPLITDDGEFLIVLHVGPALSGDQVVLQIYRRPHPPFEPIRDVPDHGVFIKEIALNKIWTPDRIAANPIFWTDHSPEWFAGGTFEFSPDYRQLIHKTRWGNTVRINLADGSLSDK